MPTVNLKPVTNIYNKIINIEEYFHPVLKWTSILPDGTDVRSHDLYYPGPLLDKSKPDLKEQIVQKCIDAGATKIQFRCRDNNQKDCFPDFKIEDLLLP